MTRQEAKKQLLTYFITQFNETTPVALTNQNDFYLCTSPLTPTTKPSDSPWVRFMIMNNSTKQRTLGEKGRRRWRRYGLLTAQVFSVEGTGTKSGDSLCEEIINIFEGETISTIWIDEGKYEEVGNVGSGYFIHDVTIYYSFDETR